MVFKIIFIIYTDLEAVCSELADKQLLIYRMAIEKKPKSGPGNEVLDFCGITAKHIVEKVKSILKWEKN